jgi:tetratricopeptide (TPR) repeat protein
MSVKVASNRFIASSVAGFYQQLLSTVSGFQELGKCLIRAAEIAQDLRRIDVVREFGLILSNIPIKEYQLIGQHFLAWCAYRGGENVVNSLEEVLEKSQTYKAKSLMVLAAIYGRKGDFDSELRYLSESLKLSDSIATSVKILLAMAILKSKEGYHKQALRDLENLFPLVRHSTLQAQYDYLNSLAVELGEVGRIEEARNVCKIVLASPLISAYPQWRETSDDIERKGYRSPRSVVALTHRASISDNVLRLSASEPERNAIPVESVPGYLEQPARILDYLEWKKKMGKEPNGNKKGDKTPENATEQDIVLQIMELVAKKRFSKKQLIELRDLISDKKPDSNDA